MEYSIARLGRTASATLDAPRDWAEGHIGEVRAAQKRYDRAGAS